MPKPNPDGFIARCPQCKVVTGAMDFARTDRKEASAILGKWLAGGNIIEPRYNEWRATIEPCQCAPEGE